MSKVGIQFGLYRYLTFLDNTRWETTLDGLEIFPGCTSSYFDILYCFSHLLKRSFCVFDPFLVYVVFFFSFPIFSLLFLPLWVSCISTIPFRIYCCYFSCATSQRATVFCCLLFGTLLAAVEWKEIFVRATSERFICDWRHASRYVL